MATSRDPSPPSPGHALAQSRAATLASLGQLDERPLSRSQRAGVGPIELVPWPATPVGRLRLVHRPSSWLVVTDGLSDPWDRDLHPEPPAWRAGLELAIEVPRGTDTPGQPPAWLGPLLLWVGNWIVEQRFALRPRMRTHPCLTLGALPVPGLDAWRAPNGLHGLLLGIPFVGDAIGSHAVLARDGAEAVWLVPMKLLHPAEYAWALEVADASRPTWLAQTFMAGDRHLSRTDRAPVVGA